MSDTLANKVKDLIKAENSKDRGKADKILSKKFIAITRSKGEEQDREKLLEAIENSNRNDREVYDLHVIGDESDKTVIVRSIVKVPISYRNTHVFVKEENEEWRCISWQVTELK